MRTGTKKIAILVFLTIALLFVGFRLFTGYYPLTDLAYKLHYANKNNKRRLDEIIICDNFKFYEKGYSISKKVSSPYPLPHFLILRFESNVAPVEIESKISMKLQVFRKEKLVYSTITKNGRNLFERDSDGNVLGVNAICITELPYPLKRKKYKNLTINITILEPDEDLHRYVDNASLLLFPNIKL